MSEKLYKYYLRFNDAGTWKYYYVNTSGVVSNTTTKTELNFAPKGWSNKTLKWERGFEYWGVMQSFSLPLEFVVDGAKILKHLYFTQGSEAECQLYIEKLDKSIATYGYYEFYYGDLDFSRIKIIKDYVKAEISEGGFMANLYAKSASLYEIDIDDNPNAIWVRMDGIELQAIVSFTGIGQPDASSAMQAVNGYNIPFLTWVMTEGYANGDINPKGTGDNFIQYAGFYDQVNPGGGIMPLAMEPQYFIHNKSQTETYDVNLSGLFKISAINNHASQNRYLRLRFIKYTPATGVITTEISIADGAIITPGNTNTDELSIGYDVTLAPDEALILTFTYTGTPGWSTPIDVDARIISIDLKAKWFNKVRETYIKTLRPLDIGTSIISNIDQNASFSSALLSSNEAYTITSGDAIRGIEKSKLKTTFDDFYKAVDCLFHVGFAFDKSTNTASIIDRADVFDSSNTIDLGKVNDLDMEPFTSEMFSRLKVGYKAKSYDEINGKEEFNTEYNYESHLKRVKKEYSLLSPYSADMYGIELVRANLTNKKLADSDSDNEVFIIHINNTVAGTIPAGFPGAGDNYYDLYRDPSMTITGLTFAQSAFNIELSPKRRIFTHGATLKAIIYPTTGQTLKYISSQKTSNGDIGLETTVGGTTISEKKNEAFSGIPGTVKFYNTIISITTRIPLNIMNIVANPFQQLSCNYKGVTIYGYALEVTNEPTKRPRQSYKLLCSTSTNLNDLKNVT
jgi:hypothetical protein